MNILKVTELYTLNAGHMVCELYLNKAVIQQKVLTGKVSSKGQNMSQSH